MYNLYIYILDNVYLYLQLQIILCKIIHIYYYSGVIVFIIIYMH